jgi:hypothetical protein
MRHVQFAESATNGQSYVFLEDSNGIENPRLVIGMIKLHEIPRSFTPTCASLFPCSDNYCNPFEFGHVMAWELGGPNVPENIVPQYSEWQGSASTTYSSWRNMELKIGKKARKTPTDLIFVAVVEYANSGNSYAAQAIQFSNWNQLFSWDDHRIPTEFKVYVEPVGTSFGAKLVAQFLDPRGLGQDHARVAGEILVRYKGSPIFQMVWDHSILPPQDRDSLIRNATAVAVERAMAAHALKRSQEVDAAEKELEGEGIPRNQAQEWSFAPYSPVYRPTWDEYRFIDNHPNNVRELLESDFHVPHIDAVNVTPGMMVSGVFHDMKQGVFRAMIARQKSEKEKHRDRFKKWEKDNRFQTFMARRAVQQDSET